MKLFDKALKFVGLSSSRRWPTPSYHAIADGLVVTATKAEAWFTLGTSNTDTQTEAASDDELDRVIATCNKVLANKWCQVKVVWSKIDADQYEAEELERGERENIPNTQSRRDHIRARAQRIGDLDLPDRVLLLGVEIDSARGRPETAALVTEAQDAFGFDARGVRRKEIAYLMGLAQKIGRTLQHSDLRARLAPAELLAWDIARSNLRETVAPRHGGIIAGARLATLTQGRVEPYSDHLRFFGPDGTLTGFGAVLALSTFPEDMQVPGDGEWLKTLSEITQIADDGTEEPVIADGSVRFRPMDQSESRKKVNEVRTSAKEQRKSAENSSTGDVPQSIEDTEAIMGELDEQLRNGGLSFVEHHPRIFVTADTRDELSAKVDAIESHYAQIGIQASVSTDEQRELWLETLIGDSVRVDDLGHISDSVGFFGSWFWGGAYVGARSGPCIGYLTGTTPGLVRNDITGGHKRGDATTTLWGGRSGRGKTTAIMLSLLDAAADGAWATMLDFKGDSGGVVDTAHRLGIPAELTRIGGDEHSGAADVFRAMLRDPEQAASAPLQAARQINLLAPKTLKDIAETVALAAANKIAKTAEPSMWAVVQELLSSEDSRTTQLGQALLEMSRTGLGATVLGPPTENDALRREPGLWVIQMPGLQLPSAETSPDDWDATQKLSLAVMRGITAHSTAMSSSHQLRSLSKVIAIPEVHRMLRVSDGRDFLDTIARMGRAFGTDLVLDSQDVVGVASMEGLVEQLSTVFIFQLTSKFQQDAAAELLHLPPSEDTRKLIRDIGRGDAEEPIRHGHCIMRDYNENAATMQWDFPDAQTMRELSTDSTATGAPDRDVEPDDLEPDDIDADERDDIEELEEDGALL